MSELTNAVTKVETSLKAEIDAVVAALAKPDADVADAVKRLEAVSAALDAETAQLTGDAASGAVGGEVAAS